MVENSDVLIGIGGGEVSRDELRAAKRSGKMVRFFPADMNQQQAREKAKKKGLPEPNITLIFTERGRLNETGYSQEGRTSYPS